MSQIFNKLINTLYYFTCHKFMSTSLVVRNMGNNHFVQNTITFLDYILDVS